MTHTPRRPDDTPEHAAARDAPAASRRHLRLGLALVAAVDLLAVALQVASTGAGPRSHPLAPAWLLAPGGHSFLVAAVAIPGLLALLAFARAWHPLRSGALALATLCLLNESHAALIHGPSRPYFFSGALLLAWLAGTALARALHRGEPRSLARDERHAEAAALGVLAAIYVSAGLSKLLHSGVSWADQQTLRAIVLSHHRVADTSLAGSYAHFIAARPLLSQVLATLTLVVQLGAPLMLVGPRLRAAWGLLLLGFHVQVTLLTGIGYLQAKLLVPLFTLPWPALLARLRRGGPPPDPAPAVPTRARRVLTLAALALALLAAITWLSPLRQYTDLHHAERGRQRDVP
ncbi:MAG: hypothetical protein IPO88_08660 [Nannocystis sp.]|uniref:hypothetical protein n=1 Tax=Nannocystis sp. TaxID=1962667 RepID=UPI0024240B05|nr:hypothetical protein [Nannocystis sp.]MBK9753563.1 hypothetical protein [Nannocystis sp.]